MHRILVTGGAGFIGSTLVKYLVREIGAVTINVDKLTYAGTLSSLADVDGSNLYQFLKADIADGPAMRAVLNEFQPRYRDAPCSRNPCRPIYRSAEGIY